MQPGGPNINLRIQCSALRKIYRAQKLWALHKIHVFWPRLPHFSKLHFPSKCPPPHPLVAVQCAKCFRLERCSGQWNVKQLMKKFLRSQCAVFIIMTFGPWLLFLNCEVIVYNLFVCFSSVPLTALILSRDALLIGYAFYLRFKSLPSPVGSSCTYFLQLIDAVCNKAELDFFFSLDRQVGG